MPLRTVEGEGREDINGDEVIPCFDSVWSPLYGPPPLDGLGMPRSWESPFLSESDELSERALLCKD